MRTVYIYMATTSTGQKEMHFVQDEDGQWFERKHYYAFRFTKWKKISAAMVPPLEKCTKTRLLVRLRD